MLQFFPTAEGYVDAANESNSGTPFEYVYNYTDHLGNIRLSYRANSAGALELLEVNDYYPFGMKHQKASLLMNLLFTKNNYKYNGKELQDEFNINLYDYGARNYDPAIGRWFNIDPLAEQYRKWSTYTYAVNNPIRFIDPDGMGVDDVIIRGAFKQEAFDQLQSSVKGQLDLTMDKRGKVTATAVEGVKLSDASSTLLSATKDQNINVNIETTDSFETRSGAAFVGGSFAGSKINPEDGSVNSVNIVNPFVMSELDSFYDRGTGVGILHETLESYVGAQQSPGSPPARSEGGKEGEGVKNWRKAHNEANRLDSRSIIPSNNLPRLGYSNEGGKVYRLIEFRKGSGGNMETKTLIDKKEYKKR